MGIVLPRVVFGAQLSLACDISIVLQLVLRV